MWNPRRFLLNMLAFNVVMLVLFAVLLSMLGVFVTVFAVAFLPAAFAALNEGQKYAASIRHLPENTHVWRVSRAMAEVYLTVLVIATAVLAFGSPEFRENLGTTNLIALFATYGSFTGMALIVIRFAYALGLRMQQDAGNNHMG